MNKKKKVKKKSSYGWSAILPLYNATHTVDILDFLGHLLVLDEEVVPPRDVFHDVSLDLVVLKHCQPIVDEDWRGGGFEIRPAITEKGLQKSYSRDRSTKLYSLNKCS